MIIVDSALAEREARNEPIRVALVGGGYAARGIAHQLLTPLVGMRFVAIANRTLAKVERILAERDIQGPLQVDSAEQLDAAITNGCIAITDDYHVVCEAEGVDLVIDATGQVEFGSHLALAAIENRKHLILVNAELDATVGPILKQKAQEAGVTISNTDGDEPGVAMNLLRFVRTIGYRPVLAGNIKGFVDVHRNPDTQRAFAQSVGQEPPMITSFADGTKLSMEATILANASGLKVAQRGMIGNRCADVKEISQHFDPQQLLQQPLVDYALGAAPGTGAFVVGYNDEPVKSQFMQYFKMGDGPLYVFYTPFHLPHLEVAITIGRVALFGDAAVTPLGGPVCEVVAVAKRDLKAGETLDGIGGFTCYGQIENFAAGRAENLLPMGLSGGCRLVRDVAIDRPLTFDDVELPANRLCDALWRAQRHLFSEQTSEEQLADGALIN